MNEERKELLEKMLHDILFGKISYNQHGGVRKRRGHFNL